MPENELNQSYQMFESVRKLFTEMLETRGYTLMLRKDPYMPELMAYKPGYLEIRLLMALGTESRSLMVEGRWKGDASTVFSFHIQDASRNLDDRFRALMEDVMRDYAEMEVKEDVRSY